MRDTWETTVRTAANTMLRYPDTISDGLEADLYALLEKLDTAKAEQPESTGKPDEAAWSCGRSCPAATHAPLAKVAISAAGTFGLAA